MRHFILSLGLLTLGLFGLTLPATAQTSEEDRGFLQGLIEDNLSGVGRDVRIVGFQGALSSQASIAELTIADGEGIWLRLTDLELDWNRSALLRGRIEVTELSVAQIELIRPPVPDPSLPSAEASSGFSLPELPVSVQIGRVAAESVSLGAAVIGQAIEISLEGSASLADGEGSAELALQRIDGPQGSVLLSGAYVNATQNLTLDLAVEEERGGILSTLMGLPGAPSIQLVVTGDAPVDDFTADMTLATDDAERLSGQVVLQTLREDAPVTDGADGSEDELVTNRFVIDIGGDIAPLFAPDYQDFFGSEIQLDVTATRMPDGRLVLEGLDLAAQSIQLSGSAELATDGWPERLALAGRIAAADGTPVLLPLSGVETRLDGADLDLTFNAETGDNWTLELDLRGLNRPDLTADRAVLTGQGLISRTEGGNGPGLVNGRITFDTLALVSADPALAQALGGDVAGGLRFEWTTEGPLQISDLSLTVADTALTGSADIALGQGDTALSELTTDFDLRLVAANLARFAGLAGQPLGGAADLAATGSVKPLTGAFALDLSGTAQDLITGQERVDPLITGASELVLQVRRDETGTRVDRFEIVTSGTDLRGSAVLRTDASTVDLTARLTDAGLVLDGISGPIAVKLDADQQGETWDVVLDAEAPGQTIARLSGTVTGDGVETLLVDGNMTARVGNLSAWSTVAGRPLSGAAQFSLDASGDVLARSGTAQGRLNGTNLAIGQETADLLLRGESTLSFNLRQTAEGATILEAIELRTPQATADVSGQIAQQDSRIRFEAALRNIGLLAPDISGPASISGVAQSQGDNWQIDATANGPGGITARTNGTVAANGQRVNLDLQGSAPLSLANTQLRPNSVTGLLSFDLAVNGPPALSSVSGVLSTNSARVTLPGAGLALADLGVTVRLGNGQAQVSAQAGLSSGGQIVMSGPVALNAPYNADLTVDLREARLTQRNLYETTANGRVTLNGPLTGGAQIGGTINLGTVEVRIPESMGPTFANLPNLQHRGESPASRQTRQWAGLAAAPGETRAGPGVSFPIDLLINAPARIFVRGRGLDAELGGQLRLTGTTADLIPQGQFNLVRGRFNILGQRLDLTEGLVSLQGAFDPFIRFIAETEAQGSSIRIGLEGPASAPELTLTSSPELPEDEVLALLLFGRGITDISALQAVQLAGAISTLSGRGNGLSEGLRGAIGVDDLDLTTSDTGETEARVGKYISENIYTDVTVNTAGETQINLNLNVTNSITVRGRLNSDGATGIGVYIERDY